MSHLRLGGRQLTLAAGEVEENGSVLVPTQWAALRAAHCAVGQRPLRSILVEMAGVEPASELGCDCDSTVCRTFFGLKSLTKE